MDSDSDNFESADENLSSDEEESEIQKEKTEEKQPIHKKEKELTTQKTNSEETNVLEAKKVDTIKENTHIVDKKTSVEEKNNKKSSSQDENETRNETLDRKHEKEIKIPSCPVDNKLTEPLKKITIDTKPIKSESNLEMEECDWNDDESGWDLTDEPFENIPNIQEQETFENVKNDSSQVQNIKENLIDDSVKEEKCDKPKIEEKIVRFEKSSVEKSDISEKSVDIESGDKSKKQPPERKERPSKMKSKLGVKLGTKIDKKPDPEPCWEDETGWDSFENTAEKYSQKTDTDSESFWNDEEQYMEIPKKESFQGIADKMSAGDRQQSSGWSSWGNWGVSSILSTASLGVSTLTNSVSQGITTVLETGIGIPDPEELARLDKNEKQKRNSVEPEETETKPELEPERKFPEGERSSMNLGLGLGNLVSGVSHITKLVESTGTKVLSGGLDTLETIGKKTMEVLQEGDPGFKKKKKLLGIETDKPVLSHVLREAKEKAEEENKFLQERHFETKAHYETLFDDHQGLVHLEALEMLSKQCDIKLENLLESLVGNELTEFQETLAQIKELCELPEDEEDSETDIDAVSEKLISAVTELNVKISYDNLVITWNDIDNWLLDISLSEKEIHQKSIECLAKLTAISVEQFHKAGELLLVKERRSTVDEADSLVQLTTTLTSLIGMTANKFSERLNALAEFASDPDTVNTLITNIFLEAANSSSYMQDAFHLLIPVLQVGAV